MVLLQRKLYFSDPEGVQHFPVGGGSKYLFLEPHITCDFPGGGSGPPPCPPIDPHKNTEAVILIETGV